MSDQTANVEVHAIDEEAEEPEDDTDINVNLIDDGLYLGNLMCARSPPTLQKLNITHILTIDLVPLPRSILDTSNLIFKFVKLADVPKEDLITHLPVTNDFIKKSLASGGTVLVHCYFGVSRSAAIVIAYMMEKYGLCYKDAFNLVKSKRRFVSPNVGFVAQLKLYGQMGCKLNKQDPRYKQFRLKFAGQKLKEVKILPQSFSDLIKPDPGLVSERPDPVVYRCKRCRRIVASQKNIIPHLPKQLKVELARKESRPTPSLPALKCIENGQILVEKLKSLCNKFDELDSNVGASSSDSDPHSDSISEEKIKESYSSMNMAAEAAEEGIVERADARACRLMWFVEPMQWMRDVRGETQGKLHCPNCCTKIGSFSWIMGCRCPCGQKVAPAFYLVPSKVEWSNIVQNVQVTV